MPRLKTTVHVRAEEQPVRDRFAEAIDDPSMVVAWFTSSDSVRATVAKQHSSAWDLEVNGPGFSARGTASVVRRRPGSSIAIDLNIKPRGLLGTAGVLAAVASGQVEAEIRKTMWKEFGEPDE